ncbi:MAG: YbhB/YbcL family Raf kinase inhibitor-like protein [Gammaproteobacteria bacterium]|nr:YbhB/YbcL family Raf kinase inhibitor-like protein [Gammaproteobacteria bacterium]
MKIFSNSIHAGFLADAHGHRGKQFSKDQKPNRSFHIAWQDAPESTASLALVFIDHDAIPVSNFSWIHWTVANIDPKLQELPENASVEMSLLEGVTSWYSFLLPEGKRLSKEAATGYGGSAPPDKPHRYTIEMYALDTELNLTRGFYLNELMKAMEGHILEKAVLHAIYNTK